MYVCMEVSTVDLDPTSTKNFINKFLLLNGPSNPHAPYMYVHTESIYGS